MKNWCVIIFLCFTAISFSQGTYQLAFLKYGGGGDYYANPTALSNLAKFCNANLGTTISKETPFVDVGSPELSLYPFIHMTGHGNVVFSLSEAENLRNYLLGGGFLHIDDNYGMDQYVREQMKKVFPNNSFVELPFSHPVFHQKYTFNNGLPKIHEHDGKRPQAFGIIVEGRLVCIYTYETDLSDGWEDADVHNDPEEKRKQALQMGANILMLAFLGNNQ